MMRIGLSSTAAALALLLASRPASALDPKVRVTQYRHTAWRVQDGAFDSAPNAMAQTTDGYIWIGTDSELVRFDGVRFQRWTPESDKGVFNTAVVSLLGASDGTLWIGTAIGLLSWKNGHLQTHVSGRIGAILEDHKRRIWAARSRAQQSGGLCQVVGDRPGCIGSDDRMRLPIAGALSEDVAGSLWIGAPNQLMRWREGSFESYLRELDGSSLSSVYSLAAAVDGSMWAAIPRQGFGVFRMVKGLPAKASFPGIDATHITSVFIDRDRALWMGSSIDGVYKVSGDRVDHFSSEHGLSSNAVTTFFEDREGNVWVATSKGLDCFVDSPVVTFSTSEGLVAGAVGSVLASDDGTVWVGRMESLDAIRGGHATSIRVPGRGVTALWQDHSKRLWVGLENKLTVYEGGQFRPINRRDGSPFGTPIAITEDPEHNVWVSTGVVPSDRKLIRIRDLKVQEEFGRDRVPPARRLTADPTGGIWLGFEDGNVGHYQNGKLELLSLREGAIASGSVADVGFPGFAVDADGSAWIATRNGVVRWKTREMKWLTSRNGLPCDAIVGAIRDDRATLWLYTKCGLVAIADSELEQWWRQPDRTIQLQVLDVFDGALAPQGDVRLQPAVSKSPDGRLWFAGSNVVQMVDPSVRKRPMPPPVYVEDVRADRKQYAVGGVVSLPAHSRDVEIEYTALSLSAPQRVRFRYKLEGRDEEWEDAGTRRQAFYSDLPPRRYRFHVTASNGDGIWNQAGASFDFVIAPAYYQTTSFRAGIAVAVLALVWAAYQLRLRRMAATFDARLQERLNERMRIARELHDTLLQSFHGVLFRFQAAANVLPDRPLEAKERLETALKDGTHAIREGRDAVQGLRGSTTSTNDLAMALSTLGEGLAATQATDASMQPATLDVAIEGTPRDLHPIIRDDIYRIGSEALRNASRHAKARRIEVELRYEDRYFQLRVRDDGHGIDGAVLKGARAGHFGLPGMRERAELIGGQLEVWSEAGMGTELALTIPAAVVYATARTRQL